MSRQKFISDALREAEIQATRVFQRQALDIFEQQKKFILEQVRDHPVSKELVGHVEPSSFLNGARGTLFGFMGFEAGSNPVEDLLQFLNENIQPRIRSTSKGVKLSVQLPSLKDLRNIDTMILPWEGGYSWVEAVERGLSGLPSYIGKKKGRSGEGVQAKKPVRGGRYTPQKFLSNIFKQAEKIKIVI